MWENIGCPSPVSQEQEADQNPNEESDHNPNEEDDEQPTTPSLHVVGGCFVSHLIKVVRPII